MESFESRSVARENTVLVFPIVIVQGGMELIIRYIFRQLLKLNLVREDHWRQEEENKE